MEDRTSVPEERMSMIYTLGLSPSKESKACFFNICLKTPTDEWQVYRRYSEFDKFHDKLLKLVPSVAKRHKLPPKRMIGANSPEFIEERRDALEEYLQYVCTTPEVWKDLKFIRKQKQQFKFEDNSPTKLLATFLSPRDDPRWLVEQVVEISQRKLEADQAKQETLAASPASTATKEVTVTVCTPPIQRGDSVQTSAVGEVFSLPPTSGAAALFLAVEISTGEQSTPGRIRFSPQSIAASQGSSQWVDVEGDFQGQQLEAEVNVSAGGGSTPTAVAAAAKPTGSVASLTQVASLVGVLVMLKAPVPRPLTVLLSLLYIAYNIILRRKASATAAAAPVATVYSGKITACRARITAVSPTAVANPLASNSGSLTVAVDGGSFAESAAVATSAPAAFEFESVVQAGCNTLLQAVQDQESNGWALAYESQGVGAFLKTYTNAHKGIDIQAYKGVLDIQCSCMNVLKVVSSDTLKPTFDPNFESSQRYHPYDENTFVQNIKYKTPWPLTPREMCVATALRGIQFDGEIATIMALSEVDTSKPHGAMVMTASVVTPQCPEVSGTVRGHSIGSGYLMTSKGPHESECQLNFIGAVDMQFPSSVQKLVNKDKPMCCLLVQTVASEQFPSA
jgi:hypothetical protein